MSNIEMAKCSDSPLDRRLKELDQGRNGQENHYPPNRRSGNDNMRFAVLNANSPPDRFHEHKVQGCHLFDAMTKRMTGFVGWSEFCIS